MPFKSHLLASKLNRTVSLRSNLVVLVLAAILPLLIFAVAIVVRFSRDERETFRRGATERTLAVMTAIDTRLQASITTLKALATSDHIDSDDLAAFYDEARRVLKTQPDWFTINLGSTSGQQLIDVLYPLAAALPMIAERTSFDEALRLRKPVIGNLHPNQLAGQHLFRVRVPVVRAGAIKYVLSAAVRPRAITELLVAQHLPPDWTAMVLDQNKRVLARTINPDGSVGHLPSESIRGALDGAPQDWSKVTTIEGSPVYLPHHRSAFSGWTMAMEIPAADVEAQFRRSVFDMASFGLIFLATGICMAWMLSNRTAKSIASLSMIAEDLGLGERGQAVAVPSVSANDIPTRITEVEEVRESLLRAGRLIHERSEERDRVEAELREVTERLELAQEAANIGAFERDLITDAVKWSPSQEILYGLGAGGFEGKYQDWKKRVHPEDVAAIESVLRQTADDIRPLQTRFRIVRPDGAVRWIESQARVFADEHGRPSRVVGVNVDITDVKRAEQRLQVEDAITRVLAESPALQEAAQKIVQVICETAGWDVSAMWCVDPSSAEIACLEVWHRPSLSLEFEAATRQARFARGQSLVGGVWKSGEPLWLADVTTHAMFARAPEALEAGLHAGVCFPIKIGAQVLGVLECFSREIREPDQDFLQMLPAIGGQIGQFIQRKRAEEELREREERLRAVVDTAVDGIITTDEHGIIGTVNPAAERVFGYTAAEMIGQNVRIIMPEPHRAAHDSYIANYLRTGERKIIGSKREVPGRRKDGTVFPLELGVSETRLGNQRIFTGLMRDITERKRAAEALAEQARLLDLSNDAILVRDAADRILYWSRGAEDLYGWRRKEAIGKIAHELLQTEFTEPLDQIVAALHRENRWSGDSVHRRRDGARIYVSTRWVLDRDAHGQPISVLETNTDITERKSTEAALREADRRKDEFLAMLGHELRNPLGVISNAVHLLRWQGSLERPPLQLHDVIERQVAHMSELVDDLLDVSRISRGQIGLSYERCDLTTIARATAEDYRGSLEQSGLELELDTPNRPLWVTGDRTRLAQVIGNLLHNAEKFTSSGGRVTVQLTENSGPSAMLIVRDTGVGMQPDILARAFEPFSQSDRTLDRSGGGLGLGLAVVKGLVELHRGTVEAHSEGAGRGAEFTVRLPLTQAPASTSPISIRSVADGTCTYRILLIEDNVVGARTMRTYLSMAGHEVEEAHSGTEGIDAARRFRPEVVLCDIGLPGMDGYAVAHALRQEPGLAEAYMIAISGYGQEEDKRRSFAAGFDMHLTKPADLKMLRELLSRPIIRDTAVAV